MLFTLLAEVGLALLGELGNVEIPIGDRDVSVLSQVCSLRRLVLQL